MIKISGTNQIRQILSFSVVLLINFIFASKYFSRGTEYGLIVSLIYVLALLLFFFIIFKKIKFTWIDKDWFYYLFVILYSLGVIVALQIVKVESLNVDRWSVISSFWEQAFNGQYPYNAQSHMGNYPGPLPFYFLMALPFYFMGEIGYFSILGIIAFAFFLRKNLSPRQSIGALIFLFLSVSVFWEILVRSTILVNAIAFMMYLFWLQRIHLNNKKSYWFSAIVGGLLQSTRTLFAIPLLLYSVFLLKSKELKIKPLAGWLLIILGCFILTFLPFILFYWDELLVRNPFSVQSDSLLPIRISVFFIILAIFSGIISTRRYQTIFYTAFLFVFIFIVYLTFVSYKAGFEDVFWNNKADISYSLFAFPFFLFYSFKDSLAD